MSGARSQWRTRISAQRCGAWLAFAGGGDLVAGLLDGGEKFIRLLEGLLDQVVLAAAQDGQEAFLGVAGSRAVASRSALGRWRRLKPMWRGSHPLDRVGLVKDDEIVLQQDAALGFLLQGRPEA